MVLAVDIGNTNIVFGGYDGVAPAFTARIKTDAKKTGYEYAVVISEILRLHRIDPASLTGMALSSVVPGLSHTMLEAAALLGDLQVVSVGPGLKTGLNLRIDDPASTGADLVCTAVGAMAKYPLPVIIIDMGTATKLTVVDKNRNFIGGAIAPGVMVSLAALSSTAALLPHIGLGSQIKVIGANTVDCMISGSVLGTASMLDGMIERYREVLGETAAAVACGGFVDAVIPHCRTEGIIVDRSLLLDGLMSIYRRNTGQ